MNCLPTDAECDFQAKCNTLQNALQKVKINLTHEQAEIVVVELNKDLDIQFKKYLCPLCAFNIVDVCLFRTESNVRKNECGEVIKCLHYRKDKTK